MHHYCFHGVKISSEFDLGLPDQPIINNDLFHLTYKTVNRKPELYHCVWKSEFTFPDGNPFSILYQPGSSWVLEVPGIAYFEFDNDTVFVYPIQQDMLSPYMLGRVFGVWLERKGVIVLHGSCLDVNGKAVGLLGDSGMGKSTLSAALSAAGLPIITDDLIPLENKDPVAIHPGIPFSRMWPGAAERFIGPDWEHFEQVHPNTEKRKVPNVINGKPRFTNTSVNLDSLVLLRRGPEEQPISINPLPPGKSLLELVRTSFQTGIVEAMGLQPQRLKRLSRIVTDTRILELSYPTGFEHLDDICQTLISTVNQKA